MVPARRVRWGNRARTHPRHHVAAVVVAGKNKPEAGGLVPFAMVLVVVRMVIAAVEAAAVVSAVATAIQAVRSRAAAGG